MNILPFELKYRILQYRYNVFPNDLNVMKDHCHRLFKLAIRDNKKHWILSLLKYYKHQPHTTITLAAQSGNAEFISLFLAAGHRISDTAILEAVINRHPHCVRLLLDSGGEIHQDTMFWAVETEDIESLSMLIEARAFVNRTIASYRAAFNGNLQILQLLHQHGYAFDEGCITAAAENGHLECVKWLIQMGYQIRDDAVRKAAWAGQLPCVKLLIANNAYFDEKAAVNAASNGQLDCLKFLIELDCPMSDDAINRAAAFGHFECIKFLLEKKWPMDITATLNAAKYGHLSTLKLLIDFGCPINAEVIKVAADNKHMKCVELLLDYDCPLH